MFYEKDSEIEFLQKEISNLMKEKYEKECIIKSKFLSILILNSSLLRKLKVGKWNSLRQSRIKALNYSLTGDWLPYITSIMLR